MAREVLLLMARPTRSTDICLPTRLLHPCLSRVFECAAVSPQRRPSAMPSAYSSGLQGPPVLDLDAPLSAHAPLASPSVMEWAGPSRSLVQPAQDGLGPLRRDSLAPGIVRAGSFSFPQRLGGPVAGPGVGAVAGPVSTAPAGPRSYGTAADAWYTASTAGHSPVAGRSRCAACRFPVRAMWSLFD